MINRRGIFGGRIVVLFVAFLTFPVFGWIAYPQSAFIGISGDRRVAVPVALQSMAAQDSPTGDIERGRDLFMGRLHFQNGGPPCMGCHNVGENELLGGGAMGPDLTNVSSHRSQTEILAVLSNTGRKISPVMQPIYTSHPLIWEEQVDLLAFLEASVAQPESDKEILVMSISLVGFLAAVGLLQWVYRHRLRGVRKPLVREAQS